MDENENMDQINEGIKDCDACPYEDVISRKAINEFADKVACDLSYCGTAIEAYAADKHVLYGYLGKDKSMEEVMKNPVFRGYILWIAASVAENAVSRAVDLVRRELWDDDPVNFEDKFVMSIAETVERCLNDRRW